MTTINEALNSAFKEVSEAVLALIHLFTVCSIARTSEDIKSEDDV